MTGLMLQLQRDENRQGAVLTPLREYHMSSAEMELYLYFDTNVHHQSNLKENDPLDLTAKKRHQAYFIWK